MTKAKESAYILKLRRKLTKRFDETSHFEKPEAIEIAKQVLKAQIDRHAQERAAKRQITYTTYDKNQHPASIHSKYIKHLLGQLGKPVFLHLPEDAASHEKGKRAAARAAAALIRDGMTVGLGTGSTAQLFIEELGLICQKGLQITAVASSVHTAELAKKHQIPLADINTLKRLDITVDGADEIDPKLQMIKGGGGALFREKVVASMSGTMIAIVDHTKLVKKLGAFPLAIEILPFGYLATLEALAKAGYRAALRMQGPGATKPYLTDNQNYIADIQLPASLPPLTAIERELKGIVGVIETGLFLNIAKRAIVGFPDGHTEELNRK